MNTVFIGGSRQVSRLPTLAKERLNNVIDSGFPVLVGDANGADKAVQKHLLDRRYEQVTVFCSGESCRNNLGQWRTNHITPSEATKGFHFYAAKDREMARAADFGLMIWDGKSAGTVLNVLRLVRAGKKAVLLNARDGNVITFKSGADWAAFLEQCSPDLRHDLQERATPEEWESDLEQPNFLDAPPVPPTDPSALTNGEYADAINAALAAGNPKAVVHLLGQVAKSQGMSQVAKDTGLAREGLYRALSAGGNPEFATVLKVMNAVGLQVMVNKSN